MSKTMTKELAKFDHKNSFVRAQEAELPRLMDVEGVATLLNISVRHVLRLSDLGKIPSPIRLGRSVRWDRILILNWINSAGAMN